MNCSSMDYKQCDFQFLVVVVVVVLNKGVSLDCIAAVAHRVSLTLDAH